ncbi:hypothetical protein [Roseovarius sp. SYSU LYC5161]|uniref:hypothetical protein n=1 Tax=Roseovarius halophilus (ex Wu et al. 2025) TaxID=3376060 RepID=UPI00399AB829
MRLIPILILAVATAAGCAELQPPEPEAPEAPVNPEQRPAPPDEPESAERDAVGGVGVTIASLGAPAEPGLWLKTPLVATPGRGRLTDTATGRSVSVDLIPLDAVRGSGSRLSLAAFQAIGAPLTSLPQLRVRRLAE